MKVGGRSAGTDFHEANFQEGENICGISQSQTIRRIYSAPSSPSKDVAPTGDWTLTNNTQVTLSHNC